MSDTNARPDDGGADNLRLARERFGAGAIGESIALYRRAAEAGHIDAQLDYARLLLFGVGTAPEPLQAIAWLTRAEAAGSSAASVLLAQVATGNTLLPLDEAADARLLRAVEARDPLGMRAAALAFARKPYALSQTLATQLLQAAATRGDPVSAQLLAERLAAGRGAPANPAGAQALWSQLAQAGVPRLPRITGADIDVPASGSSDDAQALGLAAYLATPPATTLSGAPGVRHVAGLLDADECRLLVAMATPLLHESRTVDPVTGQRAAMELRTSHDAQFDVLQEDLALRLVQARMAAAAGLPLDQAEQLIVLRYEPGQEYRPHRDYLPPEAIARDRPSAGNRTRTICVYLNDVEAGGATTFPHAELRIEPRAGDAIVFDNLLPDGAPDAGSLHAGLAVERGVKWLATLWFRQRPYRHF